MTSQNGVDKIFQQDILPMFEYDIDLSSKCYSDNQLNVLFRDRDFGEDSFHCDDRRIKFSGIKEIKRYWLVH